MNNIYLSEREKNLVYILLLILVLFLYVNFFREPILNKINFNKNLEINNMETYELLSNKLENFNKDEDSFKNIEEKIKEKHAHFGNKIDTSNITEDFELELKSLIISYASKDKDFLSEVFYIESSTILEGYLNGIKNYLERINATDNLYIKTANIRRITKDKFQLDIKLREYTFLAVPLTGIVSRDSNLNEPNNEDISLLDSLFGEINSKNEISNSLASTESKTKIVNSSKEINEIINSKVEKDSINSKHMGNKAFITTETHDAITTTDNSIENYRFIDERKDILISNSLLKSYVDDWKVDFLMDSKYFKSSYEKLEKEEILDYFLLNEKNGEVTLQIDGNLNLNSSPILIEDSMEFYMFEFKTNKGNKVFIDIEDSMGGIHTIEVINNIDDWESIKFDLDIEDRKYPLEIVSFRCESSVGDDYGRIKNFVSFKK